jgi:hypothetical protein
MNLPKIDLSSLPDLATLTGVFGGISRAGPDDTIIILMTYIFEVLPPGR